MCWEGEVGGVDAMPLAGDNAPQVVKRGMRVERPKKEKKKPHKRQARCRGRRRH